MIISTHYAFAQCPSSPTNSTYWTITELYVMEQCFNQQICCCLNNELGSWETQSHSAVLPGCDCPSVPPDYNCDQIRYIKTRSITPTVQELLPPPPPPGGWSENTAATYSVWVYCACTDKQGNPVGAIACITVRSNYVPVLYEPCDKCPW